MRRLCGHAQPHSGATQFCSQCGLRRAVWLTPSLIAAGIDPAAAGGGAVVLQIREAIHRLAVGDRVAVDLLQHGFGVRLVERAFDRVVPGQVAESAGPSGSVESAYSCLSRWPRLKMKSSSLRQSPGGSMAL